MARFRGMRSAALGVVGVLLLSGGAAFAAARVSSPPHLPPTTPERLITSMIRAAAARQPVSGTLLSHVSLGLPSLPDEGPQASNGGLADVLSYLNGDHRIRTWSSRYGVRIAELLPTAEISYVLNRGGAWFWDSERFTAYHFGIPGQVNPVNVDPANLLRLLNLDSLARMSVNAVSRTAAVTLGAPVRVAGRDAYALEVSPKAKDTLVGRIEVDVDATHRMPLRVAVYPRGVGKSALSLGYTHIRFGSLDPRTFDFTPPAGARIVKVGAAPRPDIPGHGQGLYGGGPPQALPDLRTFGRGWAAVFAVRTPSLAQIRSATDGIDLTSFLPFTGPLFSIRLVDRGDHSWVILGAVPQRRLQAVVPELP